MAKKKSSSRKKIKQDRQKEKGSLQKMDMSELDQILEEQVTADQNWLEKVIKNSRSLKCFHQQLKMKMDLSNSNDNYSWFNFAFSSAKYGKVDILEWLINSKKVPILVSNEAGSLLHVAVMYNQERVVKWLLNAKEHYNIAKILYSQHSSYQEFPLEIAIKRGYKDVVSSLLEVKFGQDWLSPDLMKVLEYCCTISDGKFADMLNRVIKSAQIDSLLFLDLDLEILKAQVCRFGWWESRTNDWNEGDQLALYNLLCKASREGAYDIVAWLLNDWELSVCPPKMYKWKGFSLADEAALGEISLKHFQSFQAGLMNYEPEQGAGSQDFKTNYHDLPPEIEARFYRERKREQRLEVIKLFSRRFSVDGSYCIPRLDLLVISGQYKILKWLASHNFLNLFAVVGDDIDSDQLEAEEDLSTPDLDDEECAVCFGKKFNAYSLECNHSFCQSCIRRIDNMNNAASRFNCPLCRRAVFIPPAMTAAQRFLQSLPQTVPWLKFDSMMTVGQVLLGIAAAVGAMRVLNWLICDMNIDPRNTFFNDHSILHIAAIRGRFVVCNRLCLSQNGYSDLATQQDKKGRTPVHYALKNGGGTTKRMFQLFGQIQALPEDWFEWYETNKVWSFFKYHNLLPSVLKLIETSASFEIIRNALEDLAKYYCYESFNFHVPGIPSTKFQEVAEALVQFDRFDILHWMLVSNFSLRQKWIGMLNESFWFDTKRKRNDTLMNKEANECFFNFCREASEKYGKESSELESVISNSKQTDEALYNVKQYRETLCEHLKAGSVVDDIEKLILKQLQFISDIPSDMMNHDIYMHKIQFPDPPDPILDDAFYSDALMVAVFFGHHHLIPWAMDLACKNLEDSNAVLQRLDFCNISNVKTIQLIFSWMKENNIEVGPIMGGYYNRYPVLSWFVEAHSWALCNKRCVWSYNFEIEQEKDPNELLEIIKYLCGYPGIFEGPKTLQHFKTHDILNKWNIPFQYVRKGIRDGTQSKTKTCHILASLKTLDAAGISLTSLDESNKTFMERIVESGNPVYLPIIEWLALEKNVDIQFLEFGAEAQQTNQQGRTTFLEIAQQQIRKKSGNKKQG